MQKPVSIILIFIFSFCLFATGAFGYSDCESNCCCKSAMSKPEQASHAVDASKKTIGDYRAALEAIKPEVYGLKKKSFNEPANYLEAKARGLDLIGEFMDVIAKEKNNVIELTAKQKGGERMAIAEVSVVPLGTKSPSVSQYVERAIKVLEQERDIKYETTAMGTIIEGDLDRILAVVKKMHEEIFGEGVDRVVTTVKIDDRRDKAQSMKAKLDSLRKKL